MKHAFRRLPSPLLRLPTSPPTLPPRALGARIGVVASQRRAFVGSSRCWGDSHKDRARQLNQKGLDEQEQEVRVRHGQTRRPWHRDGADEAPFDEEGEKKEPQTKGKLLTTPTRLLKLILPLPFSVEKDKDNNSKDYGRAISANDEIQPLALLVHPQQPLSYVERLIQAEVPPVMEDGREKMPNVYFRAEDKTGSQAKNRDNKSTDSPNVASYSGLGHEASEDTKDHEKNWVRWSSSTEMGDFIRDAARGREFAIEIEGYNIEMRVGVPSFRDRTYYMRLRLRKISKRIDHMAQLKRECDQLAHRAAHRLAKGGFAALSVWWAAVYYITFETEYGWDLVEPVTYLAGLTTIMGGYLWFLFISRDLSYKAAMNITVSRRQNALYESKGFDPHQWDQLVHEANALRAEVKTVAVEYDVDWNEAKDLGEDVKEVLEKERRKRGKGAKDDDDGDDDAEPDETEEARAKDEKGEKKEKPGKEQTKDGGDSA